MRVLFRTDSSARIGSGHLMRCLTLANELRSRGADVLFVSREHPGHLISRLEQENHLVCRLAAHSSPLADFAENQIDDANEVMQVLDGQCYDWLVVDHYGLDDTWEKILRLKVGKILVIDDLENRNHDCDLLLDQNYFGDATNHRYETRVANSCQRMLGPYYALLQPIYKQWRAHLPPRDGAIRRVLVFFGASDATQETAKVLSALSHPDLLSLAVDIVIGVNYPYPDGIKIQASQRKDTNVYSNLPNLADISVRADLVIGAGGATTWERLCLGLPSLLISVAENQDLFTRILTSEGFQCSLPQGLKASVLDWQQAILQLCNNPEEVIKLSKKAAQLVDGSGCQRIVRRLLGTEALHITIHPACPADESLLLIWANDPDVRKQSFCQEIISENAHSRWFASKLASQDSLLLIGRDEAELALGMVRFDIDRQHARALISISIDKAVRGMGIANLLLSRAIDYCKSIEPGLTFVAEVRDSNARSQRLFTQLQFQQVSSSRADALMFEL